MSTRVITPLFVIAAALLVISCGQDDPAARTESTSATIETFAGMGPANFGYAGDGGEATSAKLGYITGVWTINGKVYIADGAANTIRVVGTDKKISTIAGVFLGFNVFDPNIYSGDGGPATAAHLNIPSSVAADASGNVLIADVGNNVLRKIEGSTGKISTIAGKVTQGYTGDNGPASSALFWMPNHVTIDRNGNIYIADKENNAIRLISATTGKITTIAGLGPNLGGYSGDNGPATAAKISRPQTVAVDSTGNIYFSDNEKVIRKISNGTITTIAGSVNAAFGYSGDGGLATAAVLASPRGIAFDKNGNLLVADSQNNAIRRINKTTGIIETIAGGNQSGYSGDGGPATEAQLNNPVAVAVDASGNIYVAESGNSVIRVIKPAQQ